MIFAPKILLPDFAPPPSPTPMIVVQKPLTHSTCRRLILWLSLCRKVTSSTCWMCWTLVSAMQFSETTSVYFVCLTWRLSPRKARCLRRRVDAVEPVKSDVIRDEQNRKQSKNFFIVSVFRSPPLTPSFINAALQSQPQSQSQSQSSFNKSCQNATS